MNGMKRWACCLLVAGAMALSAAGVLAHSGRTDKDGGHRE